MSDERLHAYMDGELAEPERIALERELAADPAQRARLDQLRGPDAELRAPHREESRRAEPALARLRLAEPRARAARLPWLLVPLAAAAGLVAGLFLRGRAPDAAQPFAAVATLATGPFLVDDGTGAPRE